MFVELQAPSLPSVEQVATLNRVGRATLLIRAGTGTVPRQAGLVIIRSPLRPANARLSDPSCVLLLPLGMVTPESLVEAMLFPPMSRLSTAPLAAYFRVLSGRMTATPTVGALGAPTLVLACAVKARVLLRRMLPVLQSSAIGPGF